MSDSELSINAVFNIGPLEVTNTVITTWGIMATLGLFFWLATRRLSQTPG